MVKRQPFSRDRTHLIAELAERRADGKAGEKVSAVLLDALEAWRADLVQHARLLMRATMSRSPQLRPSEKGLGLAPWGKAVQR